MRHVPGWFKMGGHAAAKGATDVTAKPDLWNTLHDGHIVAVHGGVPGTVRLEIAIAYVCAELPTSSSSLLLELAGCTVFRYEPFVGALVEEFELIPECKPVILSAVLDGELVVVECAGLEYGGRLRLGNAQCLVPTAEGKPLSRQELESAADRYWATQSPGSRVWPRPTPTMLSGSRMQRARAGDDT